jgi:hypothetical protein
MKMHLLKRLTLSSLKVPILVCIGVILAGAVAYQVYFDKPQYITVRIKGSPGNWWWVTPRPPDWLAESIQVGDKEYNATNKATAEVITKEIYDAGGTSKDVYITAKIEAKHNLKTDKYTYKGEPIQIGGPISLNLNKTFFPGMVVEIFSNTTLKKQYADVTIKVRHPGKWIWEYDAIKIGEKILDGNGTVIAEVLDKEKKPAERETVNWQGQVLQTYSPMLVDIFVTVKIKAEKKPDGMVYREDQYLKIGNNVWLLFPSYNISAATIYEIQ